MTLSPQRLPLWRKDPSLVSMYTVSGLEKTDLMLPGNLQRLPRALRSCRGITAAQRPCNLPFREVVMRFAKKVKDFGRGYKKSCLGFFATRVVVHMRGSIFHYPLPCSNAESVAWEFSLMDLVVEKTQLALHYFDCRGIAYARSSSMDSSIRASKCRAWLRDGCYLDQWSHLVRKNWGVLALLRKVMSAWTRKNAMREVKELTKENRQVLLPIFGFAADWALCARDFSGLSTKALLHIQQYTDLLQFRSFLSRQAPVHMSALFL